MVSIVPACSPGKVGNDMSLRDRFSPSPCGGEARYRQLVATTFWRDRSTRAHSALDCTCPWIICSSSNNKGANQPKVKTMAIPTFAQTQIRRQYSGVASTKHGRGEAVARTRRRQHSRGRQQATTEVGSPAAWTRFRARRQHHRRREERTEGAHEGGTQA